MDVYGQIEKLGRMRIAELRERYQEVFGEPTATAHKQHLVRRIAWRLQVLAESAAHRSAYRRFCHAIFDPEVKPHGGLFRLALEAGESVPRAVWLTDRDREKEWTCMGRLRN